MNIVAFSLGFVLTSVVVALGWQYRSRTMRVNGRRVRVYPVDSFPATDDDGWLEVGRWLIKLFNYMASGFLVAVGAVLGINCGLVLWRAMR